MAGPRRFLWRAGIPGGQGTTSQFYRLLDPTNTGKSIGQLAALLHVLDCDVDVIVRKRTRRTV